MADGDDVVVGWRLRGTHAGDHPGIPHTGRPVLARGMTSFTFQDGRIVSGRDSWNQGALMGTLASD